MLQEHHDAILATLRAVGLIAADEVSIGTKVSESSSDIEASTTYILRLTGSVAGETLIAAKVFDTQEDRIGAWATLETTNGNGQADALYPVAHNLSSHEAIIFNDGRWMQAAFRDTNLLAQTDSLPTPKLVLTGLAGYSRVYFFSLRASGITRFFIVKFDTPTRLTAERQKIRSIRERGKVPQEFVLPDSELNTKGGILLYPAFQESATFGQVVQLAELLRRQLIPSPENVITAFKMLFDALLRFYVGGKNEDRYGDWSEVEEDTRDLVTGLPTILGNHLPESKEWTVDAARLTALGPAPRLHNPFTRLADRLRSQPGLLLYSCVHGDLQSTNVLVALGDRDVPERVAIIDFEKFGIDRPVVCDLARIEADFWRSVFTVIAPAALRDTFPNPQDLDVAVLQAFVCALDLLDGRPQRWPSVHADVEKLAVAVGRCVYDLRCRAWGILHVGANKNWYPKPYFHALLFYYAKAVLRPLVYKHPIRLQAVVLAAALAEETLSDMDAGRYAFELAFPACWPPSPRPKPIPPLQHELKVEGRLPEVRRTLVDVLTGGSLAKLLERAGMFHDDVERRTILRQIGLTNPGAWVMPREATPQFIDRLLYSLSDKNLLEETWNLLNLLPKHDVRPQNFPELRQILDDCERLFEERKLDRLRSGFPGANGSPIPTKEDSHEGRIC
jgi:hypothetical protein